MLRCRFIISDPDPRPVIWPIKHPYWVTGQTLAGENTLIAYVDSLQELMTLWPDATNISCEECEEYTFTSRFQRPSWLVSNP